MKKRFILFYYFLSVCHLHLAVGPLNNILAVELKENSIHNVFLYQDVSSQIKYRLSNCDPAVPFIVPKSELCIV